MGDNMKTFMYGALTFTSFLLLNMVATNKEHAVLFKDVNSINIIEKIKDDDLPKIKKICSYDYCDFIRGKDIRSSMDLFVKKYLKKKQCDEETKKTIYVKGLKITKIIYYE